MEPSFGHPQSSPWEDAVDSKGLLSIENSCLIDHHLYSLCLEQTTFMVDSLNSVAGMILYITRANVLILV